MINSRWAAVILASSAFASAAMAQQTTRASVDASGAESDGPSEEPRISGDGRFVVFASEASNLVPGDTNGVADVFIKELATGAIERLSVSGSGVEADRRSFSPAVSFDGRFVAFASDATNLISGDSNAFADVFLRDRTLGTVTRVSVANSGAQADRGSSSPCVSDDGRYVAFASDATNLRGSDTNGARDVFRRDVTLNITVRVSEAAGGGPASRASDRPSMSGNGSLIAFESAGDDIVANDANGEKDVFLRDVAAAQTVCISVDALGVPGDDGGNGAAISNDGTAVAFVSGSSNLVIGDSNDEVDIFVRNLASGSTERVNVSTYGVQANDRSSDVAIAADGGRIAFASRADDLVLGDQNQAFDIFLRDRALGITTRVTLSTANVEADHDSQLPSLSADGALVVFQSVATTLVAADGNGTDDVFVRDGFEATWSNYGAGWPGTHGVPGIAPAAAPIIGLPLRIDVGNSLQQWTFGVLLAGIAAADVDSGRGGKVVVDAIFVLPIVMPPGGGSWFLDVPNDDALAGFAGYLQAIEADPGASERLSFTPGLELDFGF